MLARDAFQRIYSHTGLTVAEVAKRLGLTRGSLYQWELIPVRRCRAIEIISDGSVTKEEMRPDIFGDTDTGKEKGPALAGADPKICA